MSKHTQPKPAPAQPEQTTPADGVEKEGIPAIADGIESELSIVVQAPVPDATMTNLTSVDVVLGTLTPEQAAVIANAAAPLQPELPEVEQPAQPLVWRCIAREHFHDVETRRDYHPGDVVPWSRERAERYAARGTVAIVEE